MAPTTMSKRFTKSPYSISRATPIDSDCCRLPTASVLSTKADKSRFNQFYQQAPKFLKASHYAEMRKNEIPRSMVVEAFEVVEPTREPASNCPKPYASLKNSPRILPVRRPLLALVGRKQTVVRDQLFPQKPPCSRHRISCTGVQHFLHDSSTIELPSALAESGAYPSDRTLPGFPRVPPASRAPLLPEGQQIGARKRRAPGKHHPQSNYTTDSQLTASLEANSALHPPERPSHTHTPKHGFGGRGDEGGCCLFRFHHTVQFFIRLSFPILTLGICDTESIKVYKLVVGYRNLSFTLYYQREFTSRVEEAYVKVLHETLFRKVEFCCIDCSCTLIITEKLEIILIICGCTDPGSIERVPDANIRV